MKVLNVMEDGRIAGPQLRMLRVAVALRSKVETVIAVPDSGSTEFVDALERQSVPYVRLPLTKLSRDPINILHSLIRTPSEVVRLARHAREGGYDLVHSSGGAWMFKAIFAARLARLPAVWHLNDTSSPAPFRILARVLMRRIVAGVAVAGSRVQKHYLPDFNERYAHRLTLLSIDAPVDTARFRPSGEPRNEAALRLVTVGNISPVKDYATVVKAAALLESRGTNFAWTVIGSSYDSQQRYRADLDSLMERSNVRSLRFIGASDRVESVLSASDIYVCASAAEASPTAVWEAMSCALPIVSTDVGCVCDHVHNGENGYIVPVGDAQTMASRIETLAKDADLRRSMGRANRTRAECRFDIGIIAALHVDIYDAAVRQYAGRA